MKNPDTPAIPISVACDIHGDTITSANYEGGEGLTKREYFAGLAMQGFLSSNVEGDYIRYSTIASIAVDLADTLLEELEK